jgi:hypothetical protein
MSDIVKISASPKQLSKLRNGHKVRVKPAMEGQGICMIVRPDTYDVVSRAFGRGKGVEISLSPEEILANQQASSQMAGNGIFGKKFDRFLEKRGIKKAVYKFGDVLKGGVKQGIDYARTQAPELGAKALRGLAEAVGRPELGTYAEAIGRAGADYGAGKLAGRAKGYLDNPDGRGFFGDLAKKAVKSGLSMGVDAGAKYAKDRLAGSGGFVSNSGGTNGSAVHHSATLAQQVEQNRALEALNLATGMNTGYMGRAGVGTAMANADRARYIKGGVKEAVQGSGMGGYGMSRMRLSKDIEDLPKFRKSGGQIGGRGQSVLPPALQSQPYSENFQFQFTLPPAYQRIR